MPILPSLDDFSDFAVGLAILGKEDGALVVSIVGTDPGMPGLVPLTKEE